MKRSEALGIIEDELIFYAHHKDYLNSEDVAKLILNNLEARGMLPPVNTCKLIPDPQRPGYHKHSESKREWDEE